MTPIWSFAKASSGSFGQIVTSVYGTPYNNKGLKWASPIECNCRYYINQYGYAVEACILIP